MVNFTTFSPEKEDVEIITSAKTGVRLEKHTLKLKMGP